MSFFVGLPLSASDFASRGVEPLLDYLKNVAGVNAIIIAGRAFEGDCGYESHDEYFAGNFLKDTPSPLMKKGFDILKEVTEPAHDRGMEVYSHYLSYDFFAEGNGNARLPNLIKVLEVDCYGRMGSRPCLNNPYYRQYHYGVVEDQLRSYPIEGINFNMERYGPIENVLIGCMGSPTGRRPQAATCFCPYCLDSASKKGINADRAKRGFIELLEFSEKSWQAAIASGDPIAAPGIPIGENRDLTAPPDGYFIEFMRVMMRYPEILAWNQMWHDNMQDLLKGIYGTAKAVGQDRKVGYHVWHPRDYSPFERAAYDMRDMRRYSDWIKPKMDHTCGGYRYYMSVKRYAQALFSDRTPEQAAAVMEAIFGWEIPEDIEKLPVQGLGLDYLEKDTKAYIADVKGEVPIYPGIGLDMPSGPKDHFYRPTEPEYVRDGLMTVFNAGAKGVVLSRGFGEMQAKNMEMAGKTIKEINRLSK